MTYILHRLIYVFIYFEVRSHYAALASRKLIMQTRLILNSQRCPCLCSQVLVLKWHTITPSMIAVVKKILIGAGLTSVTQLVLYRSTREQRRGGTKRETHKEGQRQKEKGRHR